MEPGVVMPPHRHTGPTHVFQLEGRRRLADGTIVGAGDYVHEPAGHVDAWEVIGDAPMVALVVVLGDVEDLAPDGRVGGCATTTSRRTEYEAYCRESGLRVLPLDA
jgi:quercetin dioxygenase-like cupin family protein